MKLYVYTQVRENYGAHSWDGQGECPQGWKCKGGDVYLIGVLTAQRAAELAFPGLKILVEAAAREIEQRDDYFEEYVVDWQILGDEVPPCEDWQEVKRLLPQETK